MAQKRLLKPIISNNITDASVKVLEDALDAGVSLDDIIEDSSPKLRARKELSEEALNELVESKARGAAIPGQSLTNDPDAPYPWEQPPQYANPREALDALLTTVLNPEAVKHILGSLVNGIAVSDVAMTVLYSKFTEGMFNVDTMLLLAEPLMYIIMALAEEANIEYNIEDGDLDEEDEDDVQSKLDEINTAFETIKSGVSEKEISVENLQSGALPQNLLDRIKEEGPKIRESLLAQGED